MRNDMPKNGGRMEYFSDRERYFTDGKESAAQISRAAQTWLRKKAHQQEDRLPKEKRIGRDIAVDA